MLWLSCARDVSMRSGQLIDAMAEEENLTSIGTASKPFGAMLSGLESCVAVVFVIVLA
jgi:hypothetical protein